LVFVYAAPRVLIAERVAPRYDPSPVVIYSARRLLAAGTELRLITNSDVYGVYIDDDDLIPRAAETVLESGFDTSRVKDHDDTTYATPVADLAVGEVRDHALWDLGSIAWRVLCAVLRGSYTTTLTRVLVSSDGAAWTTAVECAGATCTAAYYASFRYVKLQSYNKATQASFADHFRYYSVEVYPPNLRKMLVATADMYKMIRAVSRYSSQLLEFMRLT